jgi:tRNA(fMet)-specific endonuclease VapC
MILLDTDTFSLHQFAHQRVTERIARASEIPAITMITQIEALRGRYDAVLKAEDGTHTLRALQGLERTIKHLALFNVVPFDAAAAAEFDRLRENKKLKKIGRADMLIAAVALANKATLVTRNLKDFRLVPGLQIENWAD